MRLLKLGAIGVLIYMLWTNTKESKIYVPKWLKWILIPILSIILACYISVYFLAVLFVLLLPHKKIENEDKDI